MTLLHVPFFQEKLGSYVSSYLSDYLGAEVTVGKVDVGLLNQVVLTDVVIKDLKGNPCLCVDKAACSFNFFSLFNGNINISSTQLFGLEGRIYKERPDSPMNIQFIIDKLASKKKEEKQKFHIEQLVVRNGKLSYDVLSDSETPDVFNPNHIDLDNIEVVVNIHDNNPESMSLTLKDFHVTEKRSNMQIQSCSGDFQIKNGNYYLRDFDLQINQSSLHTSYLCYTPSRPHSPFSIKGDIVVSDLTPSDFTALNSQLDNIDESISLQCDFEYCDNCLKLNQLSLNTSSSLINLDCDTSIENMNGSEATIEAQIRDLSIHPQKLARHLSAYSIHPDIISTFSALEMLQLNGNITKNPTSLIADISVNSSIGNITFSGTYKNEESLVAHIQSESFDITPIITNVPINNLTMDMDVDLQLSRSSIPSGNIKGTVSSIDYQGINIQNTTVDGSFSPDGFNGLISVNDSKLSFIYDGSVTGLSSHDYHLAADLKVNQFIPSQLGFNGSYAQNTYSFEANTNLQGTNIDNLSGTAYVHNLSVRSPSSTYALKELSILLSLSPNNEKNININSDVLKGQINGKFQYDNLFQSLVATTNPIMNIIGGQKQTYNNNEIQIDLEISESPLWEAFINSGIHFDNNLVLSGRIDSKRCESNIRIESPSISLNNTKLNNIQIDYEQLDDKSFNLLLDAVYPQKDKTYIAHTETTCDNSNVRTNIHWIVDQDNLISGNLHCQGVLDKDNPNGLLAHFTLNNSDISVMDQLFAIHANSVDLYKDKLVINQLKVANADKSVEVTGVLSKNPDDKIMAEINGTQISSLLELFNAKTNLVDGVLYGHCDIYNILSSPEINANLTINNLMYKTEQIGTATIRADWDQDRKGVHLYGNVLKANDWGEEGVTTFDGYVYPEAKTLDIPIHCKDTNANILNAMLGRTFRNINGIMNGDVVFRGPFNDIKLYGKASVDVDMTLKATKVTYKINPNDFIVFEGEKFIFSGNRITDKDGTTNVVTGWVTHHNLKDFDYEFNVNIQNLLLYEEETFNSDKFKGKIYGNGTCHIRGHDGYPLNINADITPTRGSEFAYDSSTPDAISLNNFITYRHPQKDSSLSVSSDVSLSSPSYNPQSPYRGDIYMDVTIHINHKCPLKLKMDNYDDGYIVVYGTGVLQGHYYNKRGFTLNGTYNIQEGKYKLYLQDIIYRDLMIQDGSTVVFNGNPFDADIHLICSHTINSVPLSDLTNAVYTQNNRVKVNCLLDITGKLGNMNFKFDLNLPNVSDETRQIVRSYISTEEDMNKQMIYLLGFGRFYTDEYARATGENTSSQAVNSLLSSTLSGQINQMLSNAVGPESNWNFGTGITTGERGWEDMDLEGTLSGKLLDDRLLINGNFGYRDNSMTNNSGFVGDFDVKWRLFSTGNTYIKAYNLTNDRYFTKSTLNTQGIGVTYQKDFDSWKDFLKKKKKKSSSSPMPPVSKAILPEEDSNILIIQNDSIK